MHTPLRPQFDADLIAKYGGEGPRYTSYPTAVQFNEAFTASDWRRAIKDSNRLPIPADLSLYVHVPFCSNPCFYCGCNRVITRSQTAGDEFLAALDREIRLVAPLVDYDRKVCQLHLGGGTPTFLSSAQIRRLVDLVHRHFDFHPHGEFGLEIDPRTVDPAGIRDLRQAGFNRISVGIQDLDARVQEAVNRVHDTAMVAGVIGAARAVGFDSISVDLIYGLPLQTTESFARTLEIVIGMRPDRISLFNYAHLPHLFKAQQRIRDEDLPAPATKLALFRNSLNRLLDAGYEFIGMDHFALPDDALARARADGTMVRNFQGYSTWAGLDLIGFGPSAIGQVGDSFAQSERKLADWNVALTEGRLPVARGLARSTDDRLRAEIISAIMCRGEVNCRDFEREFEVDCREYFRDELERLRPMADDGLIEWTGRGFRVTAQGVLFLRAIARVFDAHLSPAPSQQRRFSRIV